MKSSGEACQSVSHSGQLICSRAVCKERAALSWSFRISSCKVCILLICSVRFFSAWFNAFWHCSMAFCCWSFSFCCLEMASSKVCACVICRLTSSCLRWISSCLTGISAKISEEISSYPASLLCCMASDWACWQFFWAKVVCRWFCWNKAARLFP